MFHTCHDDASFSIYLFDMFYYTFFTLYMSSFYALGLHDV